MMRGIAGGLRLATIIALVALLVGGVYVLSSHGNNRTVIGYFMSAVGLYPGDQVRVLGVPVGSIDTIEPRPSDVKITMSVSKDVQIPRAPRLSSSRRTWCRRGSFSSRRHTPAARCCPTAEAST